MSFNAVAFEYLMGPSTVRYIVRECTYKIWLSLQPLYMPGRKTEEDWMAIADEFFQRTNFPNVIGAIDGKHVRVEKPEYSGSKCCNYKKYFSMVLMAWVDADYKFVFIDVGSFGSMSDSIIFQESKMGLMLKRNRLNIPEDQPLPGEGNVIPIPFSVVADEAFGLANNVLRPYAKKKLTVLKRVFNYRHTRARRFVECAFGILVNKWRILHRALDVNEEFCDRIIMCCCILHNFVRTHDGVSFTDTIYECPLEPINMDAPPNSGCDVRKQISKYFISLSGCLPWQCSKI